MPKRDPLSLVAALGRPRWLDHAGEDTKQPLGLAAALYRQTLARLDAFDADADALHSSGKYSAKGLADELAKAAERHKAELLKYAPAVKQVKDAAKRLREKFRPIGIGLDTHGHLLTAIWGMLPQGDVLAVEVIYRDALANGDDLTAAAIEALPSFANNRPRPEVLALGPRLRMEAEDPAAVAELDLLEQAVADIEKAQQVVTAEIDAAAGIKAPDPTEVAARGEKATGASEHATGGASE